MNYEVINTLLRKFDKKDILQRPGSFGKMLDYVSGDKVIQRLNEAFQGDWSFAILTSPKDMIVGDYLVAHVRISVVIDNVVNGTRLLITKDGVGGKKITKVRGKEEYLDLASDQKAAVTDGLKKAATLFGVALDLYGSELEEGTRDKILDTPKKLDKEDVKDGPVTPNQKKAILSISSQKKVDIKELTTKYSVDSLDKLSESQAREIIVSLNSKV